MKKFREAFTTWVNSLGNVLNQPTDQEIMLGITGNRDDCKLVNHLLILGKQSIFYCIQKNRPSDRVREKKEYCAGFGRQIGDRAGIVQDSAIV